MTVRTAFAHELSEPGPLVSTEEHMADGSKRPYLDVGAHGKGYLIYTADGHMCAAGMNPDRPAWLDVNHPTREESFVRWRVSLAMALRNRRNQSRDLSLPQRLPWIQTGIGTKQSRPYKFDAEKLTFSDKDTAPGVASYAISWKK